MANESSFNTNIRSPRYSTSRSTGFRGGSTDPATGNITPASTQALSGTQSPAAAAPDPSQPAISQFSASQPSGPGIGTSLALGVASKVGGDYLGKKAGELFGGSGGKNDIEGGSPLLQGQPLNDVAAGTARAGAGTALDAGDAGSNAADFGENFGYGDAGDYADFVGDASELGDGIGAAGDFAGDGIPYLGAGISLAQGNYGKAAGQVAGSVIGSYFGPVGSAVGGYIGGAIGGACFITEAVMAAGGQGDNAPELMTLREFRDNVLMQTPQGQALVQEYEAIAPTIVQVISERPDGMDIFKDIHSQFIQPAVEAVQAGNQKAALEIYAAMLNYVTGFAAESIEDEEGAAALDDFGSAAAIVTHDDQQGMGMTQAGAGATDWAPPGDADPVLSAPGEDAGAMDASMGGQEYGDANLDEGLGVEDEQMQPLAQTPGAPALPGQVPRPSPLLQFQARRF